MPTGSTPTSAVPPTTPDAGRALSGFDRFPRWMWRNTDVREFVEWLRLRNERAEPTAGFYGLDLYSLYGSIREVVDYLDRVDPPAAARARERYACFDHFGGEPQHYGYVAAYGGESCEGEVVDQLVELRRRAGELADRDGRVPQDAHFYAEQNARLVRNAERYYRSMFRGRADSWNLRDEHMGETLTALLDHLDAPGAPAKVVVWAHNSHIGDARATEMGRRLGQLNVGQLARKALGEDAVLIGFTTHHGTVTAASDWDGPAERKVVRPALGGSFRSSTARASPPWCSPATGSPHSTIRASSGRSG
jgi:erythromycin esterase-like protein